VKGEDGTTTPEAAWRLVRCPARVSDQDEPDVSRRQFFRGVTGDLLRVLGELSGLERAVEIPEVVNLLDGDVIVSPERQEAAMSEIFGFMEHLKARGEPAGDGPANGEHAPAEVDPAEEE
jgi:hypothetical protein